MTIHFVWRDFVWARGALNCPKRRFPARAEKVRCFYAELGHTVAPQADVYMTDLKPANLMLERIK
jgi:hypothetical protein